MLQAATERDPQRNGRVHRNGKRDNPSPMKILIYVGNWAPAVGGIETITMDLARGLAAPRTAAGARETRVVVATRTPAGTMDDAALPFRVVRRPGLWQLLGLMRDADVVHLAGPMIAPLMLAILARRPLVVEHHGFQPSCPNGLLVHTPTASPCPGHFMAGRYRECLRCNAARGAPRNALMFLLTCYRRWLCRRATVNIMPTRWLGTLLDLPRTTTVLHGLSASAPVATSDAQTPTFAFLGRLVSAKGVHVLLDAARQLKSEGLKFRLKVIGDGPERERLQAFARTHGLDEVAFLGALPNAEVERELKEASVMLMPSFGGEVFGLVALESMLRGKLVIVSDIGALAEVVGDAGLVCPIGDVDAWASAMRRVIQDPELRAALGRKAYDRAVQHFSSEQMIAGHLQVYESVLAP